MRKPVVTTVLLLLLLVVVAAAGLGGAGTAPPAHAGPTASSSHWCNFILAGKDATADGSVLMGYNNDWSANNYVYLQTVPGDATHYQYVRLLTWGGVPEGGINVHQLGVNYGTATTLDKAVLAADPFVKKGYGGEIWDTILQQCTTAQEAITLLGQMAQTGFTSGAAGSFGIADPDEAWVFELLGGHHWVAQRVPDNAVLAHPNMVTVRQIDLGDPDNFRGSADLASFAQSIGRYDPAAGPFDVAWAYHDREVLQSYYNTNRLWGAFDSVAPSLGLDPTMPYADRPVFVVPDEPITRQDIEDICRYHYEGTSIDQTQDYTLMSPHAQTNRPICYSTTDYSAVWQLRSWKPDDIGGVMWVAPCRPCSSAYVPFYGSITSVPAAWTGKTAYNLFRAVADSLDKRGTVDGELRYKHYIPLVQSVYGAFEAECASAQASTESTAVGLNGSARIAYLTTYSAQRATQAQDLAAGLPAQMP
ncbi:MAG: dipeptidase [Deltaproteobacteria bacterium]